MSRPIDYSKWETIDVSESESDSSIEGSTSTVRDVVVPEGDTVYLEPAHEAPRNRPIVTRFGSPQRVSLGKQLPAAATAQAEIAQQRPQPVTQAGSNLPITEGITVEEVTEKEESVGGLSETFPPRGRAFPGLYAWEQKEDDSVRVWIPLPKGSLTSAGARKQRRVTLISDRRPPPELQPPKVTEAMTASDLRHDEEGLFPVAWGVTIEWPVEQPTASHPQTEGLWHLPHGNTTAAKAELWFPYPVYNSEELWNWTVEKTCPWLPDHNILFLELRKKSSSALHNVRLWWECPFLGRPAKERIDLKATTSQSQKSFATVWEEAHRMFREKVKDRESSGIDLELTESQQNSPANPQ